MLTLDAIAQKILSSTPSLVDANGSRTAAVALVLRDSGAGPEILFIERATRTGDPWSGDICFPGGRVEPTDPDCRSAAERETREETGIDLGEAQYLGRLSDTLGAHMPVHVACFVYRADTVELFPASDEVADAFWVPLAALVAPHRHFRSTVTFRGDSFDRPAIRLPVPGKPVLWGITYRLITAFLAILGEERRAGTEPSHEA